MKTQLSGKFGRRMKFMIRALPIIMVGAVLHPNAVASTLLTESALNLQVYNIEDKYASEAWSESGEQQILNKHLNQITAALQKRQEGRTMVLNARSMGPGELNLFIRNVEVAMDRAEWEISMEQMILNEVLKQCTISKRLLTIWEMAHYGSLSESEVHLLMGSIEQEYAEYEWDLNMERLVLEDQMKALAVTLWELDQTNLHYSVNGGTTPKGRIDPSGTTLRYLPSFSISVQTVDIQP